MTSPATADAAAFTPLGEEGHEPAARGRRRSGGPPPPKQARPHRLAWLATAAALAAVVAALAVPALGAWRGPGAPMEEGKLLAAAELVLDGQLPHRAFEHLYGPGDVYTVAAAFALAGGPSLAAERAVGVLAMAGLVVAAFALARPFGRVAAAASGFLCGAAILPFGVHAYSWVSGLALAAGSVALARGLGGGRLTRRAPAALVVSGAMAGLALVYRPDLILALGLAAAALAVGLPGRPRLQWLAGAAAGLLPFAVHVLLVGPSAVIQGMIVDPVFRLRAGRRLPVPPPSDALASWFDQVAPTPAPFDRWPDPAAVTQLRLAFFLTLAAVAFLLLAAAVDARRHRSLAALPPAALLVLGITPQMLQRADSVHIRFVACLALALVPAAAVAVLRGRWAPLTAATAAVATALAVALAAPHLAVRQLTDQARVGLGSRQVPVAVHDGRRFPVHDRGLADDAELAAATATDLAGGTGSVFVGPVDLRRTNYSDAFLYHLMPELEPASYFLEMNPGTTNRTRSGLASQLAAADVLILGDRYEEWSEPNESLRPGSDAPARVVARHFRPAATFGPYTVYRRLR